jgi:asparagine synthase (glutamine-hydrolysing)
MFAIGLAAAFDDRAAGPDAVAALLDAWPSAATDGRAIASAPRASAGVLRWAVVDRDRQARPIWDGERQLLFVGDVRLYDRRALIRELDVGDGAADMSDDDIAWRAYLRWGEDSPRRLVGDFAFAVWDERTRSLFAARDHLGVRPLYYSVDRSRAYVASDVRQLLAVTPRPFENIDSRAVLQRLLRDRRTHGLTFFRNVSELPAGHTVTITAGRCRVSPYWVPSLEEKHQRAEDDQAEITALFRQAVRDRLESDHAIVAHSSGGFDSSAIVMVADEVYRAEPQRPLLVTASALTPGMPCDDSRYMDALARRVRFEGVRWNALDTSLADIEDPVIAHPGMRRGIGGGARGDLELARARDARVLLNGYFGDSLMFAYGISRDMFRARTWRPLARLVVAGDNLRARARLLGRSMTGLLPPALALRALNLIDSRSFGPLRRPPRWMGPELRALYPPPPDELVLPDVEWPSHVACQLWAALTKPRTGSAVDSTVAYGADSGVEVRLPYLDIRLVERLLAVPWQARMPEGGDNRRLHRAVLGPLLPEEFAQRRDQGSWSPVWHLGARRMLPLVRRLLSDGTWFSAPYVDVVEATAMLDDVTSRGESADYNELLLVSGFGVIEAWLRRVFQYDTGPRNIHVR